MKTRDELLAENAAIMAQINAMDEKAERERNKDLLGKCFKYHNSYGGDRPKWWMYARVLEIPTRWGGKCFTFQTDCDGKIEVEPGGSRMAPSAHSPNWLPISLSEFSAAWRVVQRRIAKGMPAVKKPLPKSGSQ